MRESLARLDPTAVRLSKEEIRRYGRHLILPEVGLEGQMKLKAASVLVVGAGGLGSPLALYLAAAGIGRLGIVDFDLVEESNLQRQILHSTPYLGRPKIQSAKDRILSINPNVAVDLFSARLTSENALDIIGQFDVIVDGTDNFPTRYLINDACVLLQKPNVYGSIFRFEGQVSVFSTPGGPCYRCLYAEPPPPGLVPSCAEGGVLGVLPGIVGTMQAMETVKLILGIGEPLIGRLLLFDGLSMRTRELKLQRNPKCKICGDHPEITSLVDYEVFCGVSPALAESEMQRTYSISTAELKGKLDHGDPVLILDVREPQEYEIAHLDSLLIPLGDLPRRVNELDSSQEIVVLCHTGVRSGRAVEFLKQMGFRKVKNLVGGIDEWAELIDHEMPRY
ncbi:MAG TPA: molybdopterin-synthase adenylyltransferase MoeB [Bacteroidota bacterium]|nr:molybdopterin-synthase adenylyltransferase MoeB [Bacteroidota bacterium]